MKPAPRPAPGMRAVLFVPVALALLAGACGEEIVQPPGGVQQRPSAADASTTAALASPTASAGAPAAAPAPAPVADAGADAAPAASASLPPLPTREFQERDFSETEASRDPFRSFAGLFVTQARSKIVVQRKVLGDHYSLEELKLVGIVTRAEPRALLTDPSGFGWVAKVGNFVGKAEIVHAGGPTGVDVAVNWRVDRIRDGDVVFVREDPSHPEIPPTTRVISLRTPEEEAGQRSGRPR
jgi:type IV pilus assembly protein PilP